MFVSESTVTTVLNVCQRCEFRKNVNFSIGIFHALKENFVIKEKYALLHYFKEVSIKQTLKGPAVSLL